MKRKPVGFTLVELLVVIAIISILMGLLIPAVNRAREVARQNECGTKVKNLALAALQHEGNKGFLPGWVDKYGFFPGGNDRSDLTNYSGSVPPHVKVGGYGIAILPWLDALPTYEHWTDDSYPVIANADATLGFTDAVGASNAGGAYHTLATPNLPIFQCPSNPVTDAQNGRNSYIINTGLSAYRQGSTPVASYSQAQAKNNGIGKALYACAGTPATHTPGPKVTLDDLRDGQTFTAIYSENIQALPWYFAGFLTGDSPTSPDLLPTNASFPEDLFYDDVNVTGIGEFNGSQFVAGMVWHYEDPDADALNAAAPAYASPLGEPVAPDTFTLHRINGGGATVSEDIFTLQMNINNCFDLARPSSAHVDGVNMGFADGATRFISSGINVRVYQALLTPRGKSSDVPWPEFVLTDELEK